MTEATLPADTEATFPDDEQPATHLETRLALLERSRRGFTPIRHSFVQKPSNPRRPLARRGSVLAQLVASHQERALDAYLLLLGLEPTLVENEPLESGIWARALSDVPFSAASVSRVWLQLEDHELIERNRRAGHAFIRPRREDGLARYTRPGQSDDPDEGKAWSPKDWYFALPHDYWQTGLDQRLSLAGKAMMLIALHLTSKKPSFYLPYDEAPKWYGISPETVGRGLKELRDEKLLQEHFQKIKTKVSATGWTTRTHYRLLTPFSTEARQQLQATTVSAVKQKLATDQDRRKMARRKKVRRKNASSEARTRERR